jgi:predicted aldo/keto reductase-like oxidoreductase
VRIATKLPQYLIKGRGAIDRYFDEQLSRLRTDRIDYYLMHMLTDVAAWEKLCRLGIEDWVAEKKAAGQIRNIGFSFHGNTEGFLEILDAYDWDFCQIQYNYLDEHAQAGRRGLMAAAERGIPVVIMEPLRGGKLVNNLPENAKKMMADHKTGYTPAQWALRWLWDQPEVTVVLSGMNTAEMIAENVETASSCQIGEFGEEEQAMRSLVVREINAKMKVGCTGCGYCMPCPKGVDIPGTFAAYNRRYQEGWFAALREHFMGTALRKQSSAAYNCVGCGKCEQHCPQGIEIRKQLKAASKKLEGPVYRVAKGVAKVITKF